MSVCKLLRPDWIKCLMTREDDEAVSPGCQRAAADLLLPWLHCLENKLPCATPLANVMELTATDVWPLPPTADSSHWPAAAEGGLLSFLHLSAGVSVTGLLGSRAPPRATIRRRLIYTHYFLVFSSGDLKEEEKQVLLHKLVSSEENPPEWKSGCVRSFHLK